MDIFDIAVTIFVVGIIAAAFTVRLILTRAVIRKAGGRAAYRNLYFPDQGGPGQAGHHHGGVFGGGGHGGHHGGGFFGGGHHGGGGGGGDTGGGGGHHH